MRATLFVGRLVPAVLLACVAANSFAADGKTASDSSADGWQVLFGGGNLDAWNYEPGVWAVNAQGELYPTKRGPSIFTKRRYCDYVLELDFRFVPKSKANSGVFLRVHDAKQAVETGMEIQVQDNIDDGAAYNAPDANGALYGLVRPAVDANKPIGQWNHYRIVVNANVVQVELNGKEIVKADLNRWTKVHENPDGTKNKFPYAIGVLPREGFIGLQNYNGPSVFFRNIRLKSLSDRQPQWTGKEPIKTVLKTPTDK
jgi:hypothetical protein